MGGRLLYTKTPWINTTYSTWAKHAEQTSGASFLIIHQQKLSRSNSNVLSLTHLFFFFHFFLLIIITCFLSLYYWQLIIPSFNFSLFVDLLFLSFFFEEHHFHCLIFIHLFILPFVSLFLTIFSLFNFSTLTNTFFAVFILLTNNHIIFLNFFFHLFPLFTLLTINFFPSFFSSLPSLYTPHN